MSKINKLNENKFNEIENQKFNENYERDTLYYDFEDYFNREIVSDNDIKFVQHFIEDKMGFDLVDDPILTFSSMPTTVFAYLVAHIIDEYKIFNK